MVQWAINNASLVYEIIIVQFTSKIRDFSAAPRSLISYLIMFSLYNKNWGVLI